MFIPISDDNSSRRTVPVLNLVLIAINVFVFFGHGHEDFFGTEVGTWMLMKKIQDLHTRGCGF